MNRRRRSVAAAVQGKQWRHEEASDAVACSSPKASVDLARLWLSAFPAAHGCEEMEMRNSEAKGTEAGTLER